MAEPALRIAIVGAESTGKTALAQALAQRIGALSGLRSTWVREHLRAWCDAHGRTPRPDEQAAIAAQQQALIDSAAATHAVVVCDTTPLMTAVYSEWLFSDLSLQAEAVAQQRRCHNQHHDKTDRFNHRCRRCRRGADVAVRRELGES